MGRRGRASRRRGPPPEAGASDAGRSLGASRRASSGARFAQATTARTLHFPRFLPAGRRCRGRHEPTLVQRRRRQPRIRAVQALQLARSDSMVAAALAQMEPGDPARSSPMSARAKDFSIDALIAGSRRPRPPCPGPESSNDCSDAEAPVALDAESTGEWARPAAFPRLPRTEPVSKPSPPSLSISFSNKPRRLRARCPTNRAHIPATSLPGTRV